MPHRTVDAVLLACQVVSTLQTIVSREVNPAEPAVVTIGKITGGSTYNVIPGEVVFEGTVRALTQELRKFLDKRIEGIIKGVTAAMRGRYEYAYTYGYPPLVNDAKFTEEFAEVAREIVGPKNVKEIPEPSMGGEDMAYFLKAVPGTYFFLAGCNRRKGQVYPHHHSRFDVDEDVLWIGTALLSAMALRWLGSNRTGT
jgi:amidohydrolase